MSWPLSLSLSLSLSFHPWYQTSAKLCNICHLDFSNALLLLYWWQRGTSWWWKMDVKVEPMQMDLKAKGKTHSKKYFNFFSLLALNCVFFSPIPCLLLLYIQFQILIQLWRWIHWQYIRARGKNAMRCQQLWTVFAGNIQSRVISPRNEGNNSPNSPSPPLLNHPSAR